MPKITLGITGFLEIFGRDYGIEEPYWGPLMDDCQSCGPDVSIQLPMGSGAGVLPKISDKCLT